MTKNRRHRWTSLRLTVALIYVMLGLTFAKVVPVRAAGLVVIVLAFALLMPLRSRRTLVDWLVVAVVFIARYRRKTIISSISTDTEVRAGAVGIRWDGWTVMAAIELSTAAAITTDNEGVANAAKVLPVNFVAQCMGQYGIDLDIDIISLGRRIELGLPCASAYSDLIGQSPLVGQRRTWLVLRLNIIANLAGIAVRGPSRAAAPRALAAAAYRVAQRLREYGIHAHVLSADQFDTMTELATEHTPSDQIRERWSTMRAGSRRITTFVANPNKLTDAQVDKWWAWPSETTMTAIKLAHTPDGPQLAALVRYTTTAETRRKRPYPPRDALYRVKAKQRRLFEAALPIAHQRPCADINTIRLGDLRPLHIPIGPSGQIIGYIDDMALAVPLCDHSAYPKRLRIDARVNHEIARQLVLRAVATGAVISVHTDNQVRWGSLVTTIDNPDRLFFATAGAKRSDIAVFDGKPVSAVAARTIMVLSVPRGGPPADGVDLTFEQKQESLMEVTISGEDPVTVVIDGLHEEALYPDPFAFNCASESAIHR